MKIFYLNGFPRLHLFILCGAIIFSSFTVGGEQTTPTQHLFNWENAIAAFDVYVDFPSPENAKAFLAALPADIPNQDSVAESRAIYHIFDVDSFPILREEATSGDKIAVEILFRLLIVTDGIKKELILADLGWVVRNNPHIFLEILSKYKDSNFMKFLGCPATLSGFGYNSHPKAALYQCEKRIKALETVSDPKYAEIKKHCIEGLQKNMGELQQIIH